MLVILAGLPGTGKSTLARAVAARSGAFVLDKDAVRAALFPPALIEYSREQDDFVLRVMLKVAGWMVRRDPRAIVVIDGRPFSQKYQLDQVIHFAEWVKTPCSPYSRPSGPHWKVFSVSCVSWLPKPSSITSVLRRAPALWASTLESARRMAKLTRKASPPEKSS